MGGVGGLGRSCERKFIFIFCICNNILFWEIGLVVVMGEGFWFVKWRVSKFRGKIKMVVVVVVGVRVLYRGCKKEIVEYVFKCS